MSPSDVEPTSRRMVGFESDNQIQDRGRWLMRGVLTFIGVFTAGLLATPAVYAQSVFERAWGDQGFVSVNFASQVKDRSFNESFSASIYDETATYAVAHTGKGGGFFDISGGVRVWRNLAAGVGLTRFSTNTGAAVTGQIPHPLFFNRPRKGFLNRTDLEHTQTGVHIQAVWVFPVIDRLDVSVFGGPSFFSIDQTIITSATIEEVSAPFEVVSITGVTTSAVSQRKVGGHLGVDVTYMVIDQLGGGLFARWAGAAADIPATGGTQSIDVGGVQFGVGFRARF